MHGPAGDQTCLGERKITCRNLQAQKRALPPPHPYNHKVVEAFYLFANHSLTEHVFAQEDMAVNLTDNAP